MLNYRDRVDRALAERVSEYCDRALVCMVGMVVVSEIVKNRILSNMCCCSNGYLILMESELSFNLPIC